jgi:hypothetical protein
VWHATSWREITRNFWALANLASIGQVRQRRHRPDDTCWLHLEVQCVWRRRVSRQIGERQRQEAPQRNELRQTQPLHSDCADRLRGRLRLHPRLQPLQRLAEQTQLRSARRSGPAKEYTEPTSMSTTQIFLTQSSCPTVWRHGSPISIRVS